MLKPTHRQHVDHHRWIVFSIICLVYFFVYFHRVSTSVIVSDLLNAFKTNAAALGLMSSMYFYIYAFEQPFVGYLADRIGPRKVIGYWSLFAAMGCCIFAMAPSIAWASIGRTMIGFGVGGVYVPAIKAFSQWFKKKEFSTMIGLLMSIGNLGAVIATTPLAWIAVSWGWRPTFFLIGGVTLILSLISLTMMKDYQHNTSDAATNPQKSSIPQNNTKKTVSNVLKSAPFWTIAIIFFGIYGTLITMQGLWATPFLMSAFGIERILASKINMLIPIGVIIGSPLMGWTTDRLAIGKVKMLIGIIATYSMSWATIVFFYGWLWANGVAIILFLMGIVAGGFISVLWGYVREITPSEIVGVTSGLLNPAPFLGVAAFQVITGTILNYSGRNGELYALDGFVNAFSVCLLANIVCLLLSIFLSKFQRLSSF